MTNATQINIYNERFAPLYNFGKFEEAEEIGRTNDLGKLLNEEQLMNMIKTNFDKATNQIIVNLKVLKEDISKKKEIYNQCKKIANITNYWYKIFINN